MGDEQKIVKKEELSEDIQKGLDLTFQSIKFDEVTFKMSDLNLQEIFQDGFQKHLKILYQPFGGNDLFFYDENLHIILDPTHLYNAQIIYFTNAKRRMNEGLTHVITKFDQNVIISGTPKLKSTLKLWYQSGKYWYFCNEVSLATFSDNHLVVKCTADLS